MAAQIKKGASCGSCDYRSRSPIVVASTTKALNVKLSFEDSLKLKAAIDECVSRLNNRNRATKSGKSATLELIVYLDNQRVQIVEK